MQDPFLNHVEIFVLGSLDHIEQQEFLKHLASGCRNCKQAVAEALRVTQALPFAYLQATGSHGITEESLAGLKERLLKSIHSQPSSLQAVPASGRDAGTEVTKAPGSPTGPQIWKNWTTVHASATAKQTGLLLLRANEGEWEDIGMGGIKVKRLFVDSVRDNVTMLVRMPAGTQYPRHIHAGPEQCYVLEGDLHVGDITLHAGDYQCANVNSIHDVQYTEEGCLLLIVSSQHDEILHD